MKKKNNNKTKLKFRRDFCTAKVSSIKLGFVSKIFSLFWTFLLGSQMVFAQELKKSESVFLLQKFFLAILMVVLSAGFLYAVLYFYKKYFLSTSQSQSNVVKSLSLRTPEDSRDSISAFLERTRSEQ